MSGSDRVEDKKEAGAEGKPPADSSDAFRLDLTQLPPSARTLKRAGNEASQPADAQVIKAAEPEHVTLAREAIRLHEEKDASRSVLARAMNLVYGSDEKSLAELKRLTGEYDEALKTGDKAKQAQVCRDLEGCVVDDRKNVEMQEDIARYGTGFLKTSTLFMRGKTGLIGTIAAYGLDQINPDDKSGMQLVDGSLGVAKGLALRGIFSKLGEAQVGIAAKGVGLGVTSRFAELALTRQTYLDSSGKFQLGQGLGSVTRGTLSKEALATDVVVFGLAHGMVKTGNTLTLGAIERSPLASTMLTAGSFGLLSGSNHEVHRQLSMGKTITTMDYSKIVKEGLIQGSVDLVAGAPGGLQARAASMRTRVAPGDLSLKMAADGKGVISQSAEARRLVQEGSTGKGFADVAAPERVRAKEGHGESRTFDALQQTVLLELWWPNRDIKALPAAERQAMLAKVRSPFMSEPNISQFSDKMFSVAEKWGHEAASEVGAVELYGRAFEHATDFAQMHLVHTGIIKGEDFHKSAEVQAKLEGKPELLRIYNEYVDLRQRHATAMGNLTRALAPRLKQVEDAMNEFADARGLPRVNLKMHEDMGVAGGQYESGDITLRKSMLFDKRALPDLIENGYHELTHFEQEVLMLRSIADKLGVGARFKEADVLAVQSTYSALGEKVTVEHVTRVLEKRAGKMLSAGDNARALTLMEAIKTNAPPGQDFYDSVNDFQVTIRELDQVRKDGGLSLIDRLAFEPGADVISRHLFGSPEPPRGVKRLVDLQRQAGRNTPAGIEGNRDLLTNLFFERLAQIRDLRVRVYDAYMNGLHEQEAWMVGQTAKQHAEGRLRPETPLHESWADFKFD